MIFSSYGPYHIARLEAAARNLSSEDFSVCGVELSRHQKEYPWQTDISNQDFLIVSATEDGYLEKKSLLTLVRSLNKVLKDLNPDVIAISGYYRPSMIFALFWSVFHKKRTILFSESTEIDAKRFLLKETAKKALLRFYNAALVGGAPHKRYLSKLGMRSESIFLGYNVVENDTFHLQNRTKLKRPIENKYFLAVSRFIRKKNLSLMLSAYVEYRKRKGIDSAWDLVLCGDGELRSEIEENIERNHLHNVVHLTGFIQENEILPYFAHAECFVHASTQEQWGLVVNEAMAASLPVIISNRCGCCEDLVLEEINGFSFDPYNQEQLTTLMLKMHSEEVDLTAMGRSGEKHIQKFSPDYFARGLKQAVQYSLQ